MDYSKVTIADRRTIRYENIVLTDIERDMQADGLRTLIPGMLRIPEIIFEIDDMCQTILMPWVAKDTVDTRDYDQLYYDNIGRFKDDKEKTD